MLEARELYYQVGAQQILRKISLVFQPGQFTVILGPNGSGKSSLLKICSGELRHFTGAVYYDQQPLTALKREDMARYRAVMSQQQELSFPLSVEEVVMMGRYPHFDTRHSAHDTAVVEAVIDRWQLQQLRNRNYQTLSGGEKQRVQFARVMAQLYAHPERGCRYLFLDEPLNNLDINFQQEFLQATAALKDERTVIVAVLHDINLALRYADQLVFLKEGRVAAMGKPLDIISTSLIQDVFGVHSTILRHPEHPLPLVVI